MSNMDCFIILCVSTGANVVECTYKLWFFYKMSYNFFMGVASHEETKIKRTLGTDKS